MPFSCALGGDGRLGNRILREAGANDDSLSDCP
jgi:hypothetical protein